MSLLRLAGVVVVVATIGLQIILARLGGRRPSLLGTVVFACYFAALAVAFRLWPVPVLVLLAVCLVVALWLMRDAFLAGRDLEAVDRELAEKVGRR